jgi:DUF2075 family protein
MKEAADMLGLTPRTVAFHKYRMMEELGIKTSAELDPICDPEPRRGELSKNVSSQRSSLVPQYSPSKRISLKWATDDSGMEQVGTVYTAQGFEFDYIAVIFGNDLVFDPNVQQWRSNPQRSHDTQVKRNNPDLTQHLQHVYRVLVSRAHRGVYVHFMDSATEQHFREALPELEHS